MKQTLAAMILIAIAASAGNAQPTRMNIAIRVSDSLHVPLSGADVAIVKGMNDVLARGLTDASGRLVLAFGGEDASYQVKTRKIGYVSDDRFVPMSVATHLDVDVVLRRSVQTLLP